MKPKLLTNGKHMITVRPTSTHLRADDLVRIIAQHKERDRDDDEDMTRVEVEREIRRELTDYGTSRYPYWTDDLDDDDADEAWDWARAQVVRVWPVFAAEVPTTRW